MSDYTQSQFKAYNNFIKFPSSKSAFEFVVSCHNYICVLASKWHQPNMTRKVKINEIITEMFLILLEDFSTEKAITCKSAFAYLDSKLKSLIYPAKNHFLSDITEVDFNNISLSKHFSFEKVKMTEEIVKIIRQNVLEYSFNKNSLAIFLFIHIYPKIHWISEIMAKRENIPVEQRYETDVKRINRFNYKLRKDFENLPSGNWHEILDWSPSEKRHLAWKIINISPTEVEFDVVDYLPLIDNWRETFKSHDPKNYDNIIVAEKVYKSMADNLFKNESSLMVAEETYSFGNQQNIIYQLIGDFFNEEERVNESVKDFKLYDNLSDSLASNAEEDIEFMEIANELSGWFGKLLTERNKSTTAKNTKWHY